MKTLPESLANSNAQEIGKILTSISGGNILDVGTDSGDFITTLMSTLKDFDSFIGIDITEKNWNQQSFNKKPVKFQEMNGENLDFEAHFFDTVCISHSIHHLADIDKVLSEMNRVLKPGGHFIVQESFCDGKQTESQRTEIMKHHWCSKIDRYFGITHNETLGRNELMQIFSDLGIEEIKTISSSHYVKCLSCESKFECDNPKNEDIIQFALKELERYLSRLNDYVEENSLENRLDIIKLRKQSEKIRKRIKNFGESPASHLFFVGRKQ
jgi:ubiquinone/menaquinone biosynthesis C-methylase UbiE